MTKWQEDRAYEIMTHLSNDEELYLLFKKEIEKSKHKYPYTQFFDRMEICYEKIKIKRNHENL